MSETRWTPGPWKVDDTDATFRVRSERLCIAVVTGGVDDTEGEGPDGHPVYRANANLLAAAPDLFAQLVACVESIERMAERLEAEHPTAMALWRNRAEAGRSALAKARGSLA